MNLKNKTEEEIRAIFQPGRTFYYLGDKYHVVGYAQDGDVVLVIVKSWSKYNKRTFYEAWKWNIFYPVKICFGNVTLTKKKLK